MLGLFEHINASPIHWKLWMNLMGLVNFGQRHAGTCRCPGDDW